jgi:hypothetical protein
MAGKAMDKCEVYPLDVRKLRRSARRKLKQAQREGRTGLLAWAVIFSNPRSINRYKRVIMVHEGGREIFAALPGGLKHTKLIDLSPGEHELKFTVAKVGGLKSVSFSKRFSLSRGEIIVAGCRATHSFVPFSRNQRPNQWYIGTVGADFKKQIQ